MVAEPDKVQPISAPPAAKTAAQAIKDIEGVARCRIVVYTALRAIGPWDIQPLYSLLEMMGHQDTLGVIVQSHGGFPDNAFKMATIFREFAEHVTFMVPSYANSAATILCLSGDLILMGPVSELGPTNPMMYVDERLITPSVQPPTTGEGADAKSQQPRQRQMAAHALRDFLVAAGVLKAGGKGYDPEVLSVYMGKGILNPFLLGEFERSGRMSVQYVETLLTDYMFKDKPDRATLARDTAQRLCEFYYDHSYPISRKEARETLHLNVQDMSAELWRSTSELMQAYDRMIEAQRIAAIIETSDAFRITHWPPPAATS